MKLGKKVRYIILPVIVFVSSLISTVYYSVYKDKIIEHKITSLDERLDNLLLRANYEIAYAKSYLRQKIDSKEAALIFDVTEKGHELEAPYVTQFLNRFMRKNNKVVKDKKVINDFAIFNVNKSNKLVVHINTNDPFAQPILKDKTKALIEKVSITNSHEKLSQYYYFVENVNSQKKRTYIILQFFSPYQLTSKLFYDKKEELYLLQAEIHLDSIKNEIQHLAEENEGYLSYQFIDKNNLLDSLETGKQSFELDNNGIYQGKIVTNLFDLSFHLNETYFEKNLQHVWVLLFLLNLALILFSYFILVLIIDRQVIFPITSLAESIKEVEASSVASLVPLKTNDEVADLNASYISLINKINILANNDSLTGLANRGSFNEVLASAVAGQDSSKNYLALYFIDLDNFKYVNDTFGHDMGDRLLVVFSKRLKQLLRADDRFMSPKMLNSIARLGGDEFVVLINDLPSISAIESIGKRICGLFANGFSIDNDIFDVHASIGVAYSAAPVCNAETLLNQADSAMYLAKHSGKNNFKLFTPKIESKINKEKIIERKLIDALEGNHLSLVFLPAYQTSSLHLNGYELLLRCPALSELNIGPDIFIPIAEKTDLILQIDLWVAERALFKLEKLTQKNSFDGYFSINISSKSLRNDLFYQHFKMLLTKFSVNVEQIEIEITETCLMPDDKKAVVSLNKLKSLGIRLALDDFGTGHTSFSQLINYPLDALKIDRSFIQDLHQTPNGKKANVDIIFELAQAYQLNVVIQGIETKADFDYTKALGCDVVQGFYFTLPQKWESVLAGSCILENKIKRYVS